MSAVGGRALTLALAVGAGACASAAQGGAPAPVPAASTAADTAWLVAAGYGTLRQDEIAVTLPIEGAQVRLVPLDESVIRLLAADSYRALHELARGRAAEIERAAALHHLQQRNVWQVSFFGTAPEARFVAGDVTITSGARDFRPLEVIPVTAGFGTQRVGARQMQSALYVFDDGISLAQPLTIAVGTARSSDWSAVLPRLERERALARSRAAAARKR